MNPVSCFNNNPKLFELATETVEERFNHLTVLGLDAVAIASGNPSIFNKPESIIKQRLENLTELGLDAILIANAHPYILNAAPETIRTRLRVLYSAARAWGIKDYKERINRLVEAYPALLGYNADRNRILIRVFNKSIKPHTRTTLHQIRLLTHGNLEATVAGYLELDKRPLTVEELSDQSRKLFSLGRLALQKIILAPEHANDPAAKLYKRSLVRYAGSAATHKYSSN